MSQDLNPNSGGNPEGTDPNAPVAFEPAQQQKINSLLAAERQKAEKKAADALSAAKADYDKQIADLNDKLKKLPKSGDPDIQSLQGKIEEMTNLLENAKRETTRFQEEAHKKANEAQQVRNQMESVQKRIALTDAAVKLNFWNTEDIVSLTEHNIEFDQNLGRYIVKGEHGQPRLNTAMDPMTLDEFYKEFAAKRPHMVKSNQIPGFGSTPNGAGVLDGYGQIKVEDIFGAKANYELSAKVFKENRNLYDKLEKQAIARNLVAA